MASTILGLVDREGVECEKLYACLQGQLESRNCYESDDALRVRCLWGPVNFFFDSHVDQTVDRLGTRVEFTETEDLSKKSAGRRQRNLVTAEVFENVSTKHFACSLDSRWSEMIRAPGTSTKPTPWQVTVGFWLRMYGYSSLHTNAKAHENPKNN